MFTTACKGEGRESDSVPVSLQLTTLPVNQLRPAVGRCTHLLNVEDELTLQPEPRSH